MERVRGYGVGRRGVGRVNPASRHTSCVSSRPNRRPQ